MYVVELGPYMVGIVKVGRCRMDAGTAAAFWVGRDSEYLILWVCVPICIECDQEVGTGWFH